MKRFLTLIFLTYFLINSNISISQVYLELEDFENVSGVPEGWTEEYELGFASWTYEDGGREVQGLRHPESAFEGESNALFLYSSDFVTKLVSPPINLSEAKKPALIFAHAMQMYGTDIDELNIYFKNGIDSSWIPIKQFTLEVPDWLVRTIYLPDSILTNATDCYIAFEGVSKYGDGVCVDSVIVVEKDYISRRINNINIKTASNNFIPTGATNNPILRIDFDVIGNTSNLYLDSLTIKSLNTSDSDLSTNGVKLFYTEDTLFNFPAQIGTSQNFTQGQAQFTGLNQDLPYGISSVWVCFDVEKDHNHEMHEHIADAMIETNQISVSGNTFPYADKSPEGSRIIYESIFYDDFESDKGWIFNGEFERGKPLGLGTDIYYTPDPEEAYSGDSIIGTDLSDNGNYEAGIPDRRDSTVSPTINSRYFKEVHFTYYKWLNCDNFDEAVVDISTDDGATWSNLWINDDYVNESEWSLTDFDISSVADRKQNTKVRFAIGNTDGSSEAGGWNIDDVAFVGDYISNDVGVIDWLAPNDGCGHTNEEQITVTIKNFAGDTIKGRIPLSFSLDGGSTIYRDTTPFITIPLEETYNYTLSNLVNFMSPGWYNDIYIKTNLTDDEVVINDKINKTLFISPTFTLPYSQNFESNYGYWKTENSQSIWEYGVPNGVNINTASSGSMAWVTYLLADYPNNANTSLESPCFNTTGIAHPMIDFMIFSECEKDNDGMALLYSTDNGDTWDLVPNNDPYDWNWYNNENITALGHAGWDTTSTEWFRARQILPLVLANNESIKLKLLFSSNNGTVYEGFAIDDFKIYDAPHDIGIVSIDEPHTACTWNDTTQVEVTIENFGITTLSTGSKIPVGLDFQGIYFTTDTLVLSAPLIPGGSVQFTFGEPVNMADTGDYNFDVYTLLESNPYFYNETNCNDTTSKTVRVDGMPNYDIGWIVGSEDIDTVLDAGTFGVKLYDNYSWYFGGGEVGTNQTYQALSEGIYYVTVSKTNEIYCEANDSLKVVSSLINVKMDSIRTTLKDSCQRFELTEIKAAIANLGQILEMDDTIPFGYQINNLPPVFDTLTIPSQITTTHPNDTVTFTFAEKCDLTESGEYIINVFTNFASDLNRTDDTISVTINTWGLPSVELAYDTIYSSQADTLTLDAGTGFASYLWNPGDSITQTITPINSSYYYKVTVTDAHVCGSAKDSTYIETHDLGISAVTSPLDVCKDDASAATALSVELTNFSDSVYSNPSTVKIMYNYDNEGWNEANPVLDVGASGTVELNSIATIDATAVGEHTLKIYTSSDIDANHTNDTLEYTFNTWPEPYVDLAYDTIFTTKADTVLLIAQEGSSTYSWNEGTLNDTLEVSDLASEKYIVTVTSTYGCGDDKDSTQIIAYNLGVIELLNPESECEHTDAVSITISIKNFGKDIFTSGTSIPVGFIFNNNPAVYENLVLVSDLNPGQTANYSFSQKVDMANIDTYSLKLFTDLKLDVQQSNDTLIDALKTYGYPEIELGDDIYTTEPDSVEIIANPGYITYWWNEGTIDDTLKVTYPASKLYSVTVTDINGCTTTDEINVYTYDIGISSINSPETNCTFGSAETVDVTIINNGQDTLLTGESINLTYSLNGGSAVDEALVLISDLLPGSTIDYTFTSTLDLTALISHNIKVTCSRVIDVNDANDTLSVNINEVGYPSFSLGDDIYTTNPNGTILTAPVGYDSYLWQDGSTSNDFTVTYAASYQYSVTVTDEYGCEGYDTLELYTYNVAASGLNTPFSQCELSNAENVNIDIINNSLDTLLTGESINVSYVLNSGSPINASFNLTEDLYPDSIVNYTFTQKADLSANQVHELELFAELASIDVNTDDAIMRNVDYQKPTFDLGADVNTGNTQYPIDAGAGYTSYLWFDDSDDQTYVVDINDQNPGNIYSVTVTNSYGCIANDEIEVTFTTTPDLAVTAMLTPESGCWNDGAEYPVHIEITNSGVVNLNPGDNFIVGYKIDEGTAVTETFNVTTAMGSSDTRNYTFTDEISFSSAKIYLFKPFVKLANDGNISNDTLTTGTILEITAPEVILGSSDTISTSGTSYEIQPLESYSTYLWDDGSEGPTLTVNETGSYSVTITDGYGCSGEGSIYINFLTDIENLIQGDGYKLTYFPNPVSEQLMIQFENKKSKDVIIEIVSSNGQIVYNKKISNVENSIEKIDVTPFSNGVYYIRFNIDDEFYIRKIIIQ